MRPTAKDRPPRILWAYVNGVNGAQFAGSGDLIITRTAVGVYSVTLDKVTPGASGPGYAPIVTVAGAAAVGAWAASIGAVLDRSFNVFTFLSTTGAATDINWSLQVMTK